MKRSFQLIIILFVFLCAFRIDVSAQNTDEPEVATYTITDALLKQIIEGTVDAMRVKIISSAIPTGASTAANQATVITRLDSMLVRQSRTIDSLYAQNLRIIDSLLNNTNASYTSMFTDTTTNAGDTLITTATHWWEVTIQTNDTILVSTSGSYAAPAGRNSAILLFPSSEPLVLRFDVALVDRLYYKALEAVEEPEVYIKEVGR